MDEFEFTKCAVRTQRWRFVDNSQLYDISADPSETTDVSGLHSEVVSRLRQFYEAWWASLIPMLVNENLPKVAPEDQPLAIRYHKQLNERGIPAWEPAEL